MPRSLPTLPDDSRYRILGLLGAGGQSRVYRAIDQERDRTVAVRQEARAEAAFGLRAGLRHPCMPRVLDVIRTSDAEALLVEEFVAAEGWDAAGPTSTAEILQLARHMLALLAYLHDHDLVHRDIKPANIVFARHGVATVPVLLDFGFARRVGADSDPRERSGTLGTVAPEVLSQGREPFTDLRSADLFSLGTTLLAATHGVEPDPTWSLDATQLRALLDASPAELRALLVGLCSTRTNRFFSAAEALGSLPRTSIQKPLWTSPREWPTPAALPKNALAAVQRLTQAGGVLCLTGNEGTGKQTLAERIASHVRMEQIAGQASRTQRGVRVFVDVTDSDGARLREIVRCARPDNRALTLVTTQSKTVVGSLRTILDDARFAELSPPRLSAEDLRHLGRWLPLGDAVDTDEVLGMTEGDPASIVSVLQGSPALDPSDVADSEIYVAIRESGVPPEELQDATNPSLEDLVSALPRGRIERDRDGRFRTRNRSVATTLLAGLATDRVRAMHAHAARWSTVDTSYHRAAGGDQASVAACLATLAGLEQAERAETRLARVVEACGAEAVTRAEAFPHLARRLVRESRIDVIEAVLGAVPESTPEVDAVRAFVASERGDSERAAQLARDALTRDPSLPCHAHLDLARALQFLARWEEALAALDAADNAAGDDIERAEVLRIRGLVFFRIGRTAEAEAQVREALALLDPSKSRALVLALQQNLAMMLRHRGALEEAAELFELAGVGLTELADVRAAAIVWINSAIAWQDAGRPARARALRLRALDAAETVGLPQVREIARAGVGISLALEGATAAAYALLCKAAQGLADQGMKREAHACRVHAAAAVGDATELEHLLHAATESGFFTEAALAWRALLWLGRAGQIQPGLARAMLAACGRSVREQVLVELHARRVGNARSDRALERMTTMGLPRSRLLACEALAARSRSVKTRRGRIAAAIRLARASESPADRIRVAALAATASRAPALHASWIERELVALEKLWPSPAEETPVKTWTQQIESMRSVAADLTTHTGGGSVARLAPVLRLNHMLLDETTTEAEQFDAIVREAMCIAGAHRGLLVVRGSSGEPVRVSLVQTDSGELEPRELDFSRSLLDEVLEHGLPIVTVNALADPDWRHATSVVDFELASIACLPIRVQDETVGALYLDNPFEEGCFAPDAVDALEVLATQVSLCLTAARRRAQVARLNAELETELDRQTELLGSTERELAKLHDSRRFLYQSESVAKVMKRVRRLAATDLPVHVSGETGTGKELIARKLHELSSRRNGPFISENCSAISAELLESELFGHVSGAFTGASRDKLGLLRTADGGTLFLDEIGDMSLALQARLLRVLEGQTLRPVGSDTTVSVDVRIVTATHRNLARLVEEGEFREDLYYRIVVAEIGLPPLRQRREDIRLIAMHFLRLHGTPEQSFTAKALELLEAHDWPGNVRELENAVRNAIVMAHAPEIDVSDLTITRGITERSGQTGLPTTDLKVLERLAIEQALEATGGNRAQAAKLLGLSRSAIFKKIRDFGLRPPS